MTPSKNALRYVRSPCCGSWSVAGPGSCKSLDLPPKWRYDRCRTSRSTCPAVAGGSKCWCVDRQPVIHRGQVTLNVSRQCMPIPEKFPICWMPDLQTSHVGYFEGCQQFFLAHHRVPTPGSFADYLALYCFDEFGTLSSHTIRGPFDERVSESVVGELMSQLGQYEFADICVAPFAVQFAEHSFGLIPDTVHSSITLQPGSVITFVEPWDGEYYT